MADTEKAMRENQAFVDGEYEVSKDPEKNRMEGGVIWLIDDDHELHLEAHVTLLKSEEAAKWDQERWDALIAHIEKHREFYLNAMAAAMAPAAQPPGQVPLPGLTAEGNEPMLETGGLE